MRAATQGAGAQVSSTPGGLGARGGPPQPRYTLWKLRLRAFRGLEYGLLAVAILVADIPLLWIFLTALKPDSEIIHYPPTIWPQVPSLGDYFQLFAYAPFGDYLLNSSIIATVSTVLVVAMGTVAAYAFVRFDFIFLRGLAEASLFAYMIPSILLLVPLDRMVLSVNLENHRESLIIIYTARLLPFALWTLRSYFQGVSVDLEQAAMVDGCTRFGAFWRVVLPQAVPGMIATAVFTFNAAWSEYLFGSTLMTSPTALTISPGLALLNTQTGIMHWGLLMAGAVLATVPVLVLFVIAQSQLVETWGEGAVK
jgi:ABC-type glycerol-3-phosphate transport system permease component